MENNAVRCCLFILTVALLVGPGIDPGRAANGTVDHELYGDVLGEYVRGGFFGYQSFHQDRAASDKLNRYLQLMSRVNPGPLSRNDELAYWINLYNAATLQLVNRHYPVGSIKDIGGWFSSPWSTSFVQVGDRTLTLDEIEHEIIRVRFDEPRIHFALVCAAQSCPPLRGEPYVGSRLDQQLEDQARQFLNSSKNRFRLQNERLVLQLSSIFSWYGEDFGGQKGVVRFLKPYLDPAAQSRLKNGRYRVEYLEYDWSLNQAPGPYPPIS